MVKRSDTPGETILEELERLREMERRISRLPEQEFVGAMAVVLQILAQAARAGIGTGYHINQTDAVAAVDRAQTYVNRLVGERDELQHRVEHLESRLSAFREDFAGALSILPAMYPEWRRYSRDLPDNTAICQNNKNGVSE